MPATGGAGNGGEEGRGGTGGGRWITFGAAPDLEAAYTMDWIERGRYVYEMLVEHAARSQAEAVALLKEMEVFFETYWISNSIYVEGMGEDEAARLAALPGVAGMMPSATVPLVEGDLMATWDAGDFPDGRAPWGVADVKAPQGWSRLGVRGEGIVIGSIDTGVLYTHEALAGQYRGLQEDGSFVHDYNWFDPADACGNGGAEPCDNNGHGTHTVGVMVGGPGAGGGGADSSDPRSSRADSFDPRSSRGDSPDARTSHAGSPDTRASHGGGPDIGGSGPGTAHGAGTGAGRPIGVAPGARWIAAKGCEDRSCSDRALMAAIQFMLAPTDLSGENPDPDMRPHIVNNSWGGPAGPGLREAVKAWAAAGIFPVFAAGNSGPRCRSMESPAYFPEAYAVGNYAPGHFMWPTSSRGPAPAPHGGIKPDIAAPGTNILSAWNDGGYAAATGTSMAAPHVAGAVALLWAGTGLAGDIDGTRRILDESAVPMGDVSCGGGEEHGNVWGRGRLDILRALHLAAGIDTAYVIGTVGSTAGGVPGGVTVTARTRGGVSVVEAGADERGEFILELPPGHYIVEASAEGYRGDVRAASLQHPGEEAEVILQLKPESEAGPETGGGGDAVGDGLREIPIYGLTGKTPTAPMVLK